MTRRSFFNWSQPKPQPQPQPQPQKAARVVLNRQTALGLTSEPTQPARLGAPVVSSIPMVAPAPAPQMVATVVTQPLGCDYFYDVPPAEAPQMRQKFTRRVIYKRNGDEIREETTEIIGEGTFRTRLPGRW